MSIQQSFNQMLYSGTVAAGLYAHSPQGQKAAKIRGLKQEEAALKKKADIEMEEAAYIPDPKQSGDATDRIYRKYTKDVANLKAKRYKLDPTEKAYQSYVSAVDEARYVDENFKDRISFLSSEDRKLIKKAKQEGGDLNNG